MTKRITYSGKFSINSKELKFLLNKKGFDARTSTPTKNDVAVLLGENPSDKFLAKLEMMHFNGFYPVILHNEDLTTILSASYDPSVLPDELRKNFKLTYNHYQKCKLEISPDKNPIAGKETMLGYDFKGNYNLFNQLTGCLGALGDHKLYPETQVIILSDKTVENLKNGIHDVTINYFEEAYNKADSDKFYTCLEPFKPLYEFISESDLLDWYEQWSAKYPDPVVLKLFNDYKNSIL